MVISVKDLKRKYKVGSAPAKGIDCSVGGALCLEMVPDREKPTIMSLITFPSDLLLAEFLGIANLIAGEIAILTYAKSIFEFNAQGNFDEAWDELEKALADES